MTKQKRSMKIRLLTHPKEVPYAWRSDIALENKKALHEKSA
jgi:hypothetical protein